MQIDEQDLLRLLRILHGYEALVEDLHARHLPEGRTLKQIERAAVERALDRHLGIQASAAQELGLTPRTMAYKLRQLGLGRNLSLVPRAAAVLAQA